MYTLTNVKERHSLYPDTFEIPSDEELNKIDVNDYVKLGFEYETSHCSGERMWVKIIKRNGKDFIGTLADCPVFIPIDLFNQIKFTSDNILDIY